MQPMQLLPLGAASKPPHVQSSLQLTAGMTRLEPSSISEPRLKLRLRLGTAVAGGGCPSTRQCGDPSRKCPRREKALVDARAVAGCRGESSESRDSRGSSEWRAVSGGWRGDGGSGWRDSGEERGDEASGEVSVSRGKGGAPERHKWLGRPPTGSGASREGNRDARGVLGGEDWGDVLGDVERVLPIRKPASARICLRW